MKKMIMIVFFLCVMNQPIYASNANISLITASFPVKNCRSENTKRPNTDSYLFKFNSYLPFTVPGVVGSVVGIVLSRIKPFWDGEETIN